MSFKCLPGCADCCGPVNVPKSVFEKHKDKMQVEPKEIVENNNEVYMITNDLKCVYLERNENKCMIYEDRPQVCKMFGHGLGFDLEENVLMYCPHLRPNGNEWSPAKKKHLQRRVKQVNDGMMKAMEEKYGKVK